MKSLLSLIVFAFIFQCNVTAQLITLDSSFGSAGIVTHTVGNINDEIRAIAIQPNGKIVTAGCYILQLSSKKGKAAIRVVKQ